MASELKLRRGSSAVHATFTGSAAEVTVNTDTNQLVSHDGVTPGGHPVVMAGTEAPSQVIYKDPSTGSKEIGIGGILTDRKDFDYFGIVDSRSVDQTARVQDALYSGRGAVTNLSGRQPRITGQIVIPDNMQLVGMTGMRHQAFVPANPSGADGGQPAASMRGSMFIVDCDPAVSPFKLTGNRCGMEGWSFFYPENTPDKWTLMGTDINGTKDVYQPVPYAPTIDIDATEVRLSDLMLWNSYQGIRVWHADKVDFQNLGIVPMHIAIQMRELGAGGQASNVNIYPFLGQVYNFAGLLNRMNGYADNHGTGITEKVGSDFRTFEQMMWHRLQVIGVADGMKVAGKGTILSGAKFDNCMRCIEILENNASSYHQFSDIWASSFYGDELRKRNLPGEDFVIFRNSGGGHFALNGLKSPRSDGIGIDLPRSVNSSVIRNVALESQGHRGVVAGTDSGGTRRLLTLDSVHISCRDAAVIPFTVGDFTDSRLHGLTYSGAPAVPFSYIGTAGLELVAGLDIEAPQITPGVSAGSETRVGSYSALIRGNDKASTAPIAAFSGRLENPGGTQGRFEIMAANIDTTGGGGTEILHGTRAGSIIQGITFTSVRGFRPAVGGAFPLGEAGAPWSNIYGVNAQTITSDARAKTRPVALSAAEIAAGLEIARSVTKWQWIDRVMLEDDPREGGNARWHFGPTVQDVMRIMKAHGLDALTYGLVGYAEWDETPEMLNDDGSVMVPAREAGNIYQLRGQELSMLIAAAQAARLTTLESRLEALEAGRDGQ